MPSWLNIVVASLAIHLFALEALAERAKQTGQIICVVRPLGPRILIGAAIIAMAYGAGTETLSDDSEHDALN